MIQSVPAVPDRMVASCARCGTTIRDPLQQATRRDAEVAALAIAALILYPLAVALPIMSIERFGHVSDTSILGGIVTLFTDGQIFVGIIVLLCSVIFPLGKLAALIVLTTNSVAMANRHRALTFRLVEWTGRWGMMDVLLVAVLVAALKLGDLMQVHPGPAAAAFAACVLLSLIATALFDPHRLWDDVREA